MKITVAWALTILFVALKLTNYIDWSWVWVLAPLWAGFALWFVVIMGTLLLAAIFAK